MPALLAADYQVIVLKRRHSDVSRIVEYRKKIIFYDVDGQRTLEQILDPHIIVGIIHLATDYGKKNNNDIVQMCRVNIELAAQLLNWAVRNKCKFFINTHTYAHSGYTLYSAMKNAFLEIMQYYKCNSSLKMINMRLEYVYGPKDDTTKLIPAIIESFLNGTKIKSSLGMQKEILFLLKMLLRRICKCCAVWRVCPTD